MSEGQAKAEAEALRDALAQALDSTLVTRGDVLSLEKSVHADLVKMDKEIAAVRADISLLKWMVGVVMAGVASQLLKSFFS